MNDIIITDFGPQHFEQALDVLYESNCMHARCDSKQFICAPKENSVPCNLETWAYMVYWERGYF